MYANVSSILRSFSVLKLKNNYYNIMMQKGTEKKLIFKRHCLNSNLI